MTGGDVLTATRRGLPPRGFQSVAERPAWAALLAVLVGAATGGLVAIGGPALLLPVAVVAVVAAVWAAPRHPFLVPLVALASAATPPLVGLPFMVAIGGKSLYLSDILLPLAAVLALTRRTRVDKLDLLAWAYTAVIAAQAVAGVLRRQPFEAFSQDLRGPVYLICGYFVVSRLLTPSSLRYVVRTVAAILWYAAGLMAVTIVTGVELLAGRTEAVRVYDVVQVQQFDATRFINNSKVLAFMALVTALGVLFSRRASRRARTVAALLALPAFTITFLGYARATLLALGLCLVVLVLLTRRLRFSWPAAGAALLAVAGVTSLLLLTGNGSVLNDPEGNAVARQVAGFEERVLGGLSAEAVDTPGNEYRLLENHYALRAAGESPLFGKGMGASYHPVFFDDPLLQGFKTDPEYGSRFIHNGWLWYLVKTGAVGLVAALALVLVPVVLTLRRRAHPDAALPVEIGVAVALLGVMVIHLFEPDMHRVGGAPVAGAALGYLCLRATALRSGRTERPVGEA